MKFSIIIALLVFSHNLKAQSQLETQLRNLPLESYLNKPIDTLLAHIPGGYDTTFIIGPAGNINRGASFQINYPPNNQFWIYVNITDAQYITINRDARNTASEVAWPLMLLRKEKIGGIRIFTGAYQIINQADIY